VAICGWATCCCKKGPPFAEAWNFGPLEVKGISAQEIVEELVSLWGSGEWVHTDPDFSKAETNYLRSELGKGQRPSRLAACLHLEGSAGGDQHLVQGAGGRRGYV
jgi:hypothetical protein